MIGLKDRATDIVTVVTVQNKTIQMTIKGPKTCHDRVMLLLLFQMIWEESKITSE